MKTSVQKITAYLAMLLLATLILHGCNDVAGPDALSDSELLSAEYSGEANFGSSSPSSGESSSAFCIPMDTVTLKAGKKSKNVGEVSYVMDSKNITVKYSTNNDWKITETHLFVSDDLNDLPTAGNGAPVNGHFPYGDEFSSPQTEITYTIPLSEVGISPGDDIFIVAHAVVKSVNGDNMTSNSYTYSASTNFNDTKWGSWGGKWGDKKDDDDRNGKWGSKKDDDDDDRNGKWGDNDDNDKNGKKGGKWGDNDDNDDRNGKWGGKKDDDDDHSGKWGDKDDDDGHNGKWGDKDDDDGHHKHGEYCGHNDDDDGRDKKSSEETAYAGDEEGDGKRWWWYIHVTSSTSCNGDGVGGTD